MREVAVTDHAIARYEERVRPGLPFRAAEAELLTVLRFAEFTDVTPEWARGHGHEGVVGWLLLGDGIAFPLVRNNGLVAVTCLVAGGASEDVLAARRLKRATRRRARRYAASREPTSDRWGARERRRRGAAA